MHVFLIAAMTIDGFIGRSADDRSFDWTSEADKKFYVAQIKTADVIVIGSKTFQTFTRYPKGSRWIIYSSTPETFVNPKPSVITAEATKESPIDLIKRLEKEGVKTVAVVGGATLYSLFLGADLVDELFLTIEPVIFGTGIKLFAPSESSNTKLELVESRQLSDEGTILLRYKKK